MLVHVLSAFPIEGPNVNAALWLRESAAADPFGEHHLTDDPAKADLILFAENHPGDDPYLLSVARHPVYRRYPDKSFLYHDADDAVCVLRGLYPSIRRTEYQPERCRSAGYIARLAGNHSVRYIPEPVERKWLYTFFGENNSAVRAALLAQAHPDGNIRDTTGRRHWAIPTGPERDAFMREFAEAIQQSQFVLCPAGIGPCTYRLFETMEMGRVSVIISDDWVPIPGPSWDEFAIQLPENQITNTAAFLQNYSARHEEMGRKARAAWEHYFAKDVCFHRLTELCADVMTEKPVAGSALRARIRLLTPHRLRTLLRSKYRQVTDSLRKPT